MRVAAKHSALAAHDQRRLGVDLEVCKPVDDMHARLLHLAGPLDVSPLVEPRLELDQTDRLLRSLGGVDQRRHQGRVVGGAIHRRLDRNHVGVLGAGPDKRLDTRGKRVVGQLHQNVAAVNLGKQIDSLARGRREPCPRQRNPGLELQVGPVDIGQLRDVRHVHQARGRIHLEVGHGQALLEPGEHGVARTRRHLEPHHVAEPPAAQLGLDRFEQIVGLVTQLEVRVAGHPEVRVLEHLHPGEEPRQEVGDHLFLRDQARLRPDGDKPREPLGHLHPRRALLTVLGVAHPHREALRETRDVGKRLTGANR